MSSSDAAPALPQPPELTANQKRLVRETLFYIESHADQLAETFYARLFKLDPKLRPLFKGDITEQGRKLIGMIRTTIRSLDRMDEVKPNLQLLGTSHRLIGVMDRDFDTFGEALLWALEQGLKNKFTADVKEAWQAVYAVLAAIVKG